MTTWLVTGAAGFIGANLSAYLLARGVRVVGLDDLSTGTVANVDRITDTGGESFRFVQGSVDDLALVADVVRGCDVVIHLAGQVSVQHALAFPLRTNQVNVTGFLTVAEAAAQARARKLIYASSCAVYGESDGAPIAETAPTHGATLYAASKLSNELYAESLRNKYDETDFIGLRFFNVFGPWQSHTSAYAAVIARWTAALVGGERPILFGDGSATRDFCFVENVCAAIYAVATTELGGSERVFNIGTGRATTLSELYDAICAALSQRGVPVPDEGPDRHAWRSGDLLHSCADISLASRLFNYRPEIDLAEGLRRLIMEEYPL